MAVMSDFERVFEVGPVFRAEDSNTNRHLCEFTGIDVEMQIVNDYFEVIELLENLFLSVFTQLEEIEKYNVQFIREQFNTSPLNLPSTVPRIHFKDASKLLNDNGYSQDDEEDFSTENEKALGKILSDK